MYLPARVLRLGGDCVRSTNARIIADGVTGEKCGTTARCSALSPAGDDTSVAAQEHTRPPHADVGGMLHGRPGMQLQWAVSLQKRNRDRGLSPKFWSKLSASPFAHRHFKIHSLICIVCIKSRAICSHFFILLATTVLLRLGCREGVPCSEIDEEPKDKKPRQQTGRDLAEQAVQRARDSPSVGRGR